MANTPQNQGKGNAAAAAAAAATGAMRSGIRAVVNDAEAANGALLSMGLAMATGASKAQVAMAGLREFLVGRLLGPMANLGAVALGVSASILRMGRSLAAAGKDGAAAIERLEKSFRVLLGGAEAASKRVRELVRFAKETPFEMRGVANANRLLQVLTKGALATKEGMKLVGDAAAVAGADLENVAMQVGRLYDGLQNGTPVGEAAFRLQELGLLSGAARAQIEQLQKSGAEGSAVWAVAEADLKRYSGAMKEASVAMDAMERQLEDAQGIAESTFAKGYEGGIKAGLEAEARAIENLTPALKYMGEYLGEISGRWDRFKAAVMNATVGATWFQKAVVPVFQVVTTLVSGVTAATGAFAAYRAIMIGTAVVQGAFGKATQGVTTGLVAQAAAARAAAVSAAGGGFAGQVAGMKAWQAAAVAAASAGGKFRVGVYAMTVASGALSGVFGVLRAAVVGLGRAFLALGPVGWLLTAVGAGVAAWAHYRKEVEEAAETVKSYAKAQREATEAIAKEAAAVKTAADAQALRSRALREVIELLEEQKQIQEEVNAADARKAAWDAARAKGGKGGTLTAAEWAALPEGDGRTPADEAARERLKENQRAVEDRKRRLMAEQAMAFVWDGDRVSSEAAVAETMSPALSQDADVLKAQLEEIRRQQEEKDKVRKALALADLAGEEARLKGDKEGETAAKQERLKIQAASSDRAVQLQGQMEAFTQRNTVEGQMKAAGRAAKDEAAKGDEMDYAKLIQLQTEEVQMKEKLQALGGAVTDEDVAAYNAAAVELERLNKLTAEMVALQLKAVEAANFAAGLEVSRAKAELLDDEIAKLEEIQRLERANDQFAAARGEMSPQQVEANEERRQVEMEKAQRDRARRENDARVSGNQTKVGLRDDSLEKEMMLLDIEEQKVQLARVRGEITEEEARIQMETISAQRERAKLEAERRKQAVVAAVQEARLMREAGAARRGGNLAEGDRLEGAANAIADAQFAREEQLRLLAAGFDEVTASAMAQEAVADRVADREERRATAVRRTAEEMRKSEAALKGNLTLLEAMVRAQREAALVAEGMSAGQARAAAARESALKGERGLEELRVGSLRTVAGRLREQGDERGARRYDKRADKLDEKNRIAELIGEGMQEKVARRIARGERQMAELGREASGGQSLRFGGQVAVSSLVRVGGGTGPNVGGALELQRKSNRLLEKIEANTREPREERGFGGVSLTQY